MWTRMPLAGGGGTIPRAYSCCGLGALVMFAPRRVLIVLLIGVLASGALSTPALRHSHAMSEHSDAEHSEASHSSAHHHHGHAHRHASEAEPTWGETAVEHVHVMWFGIGLALPVSSDCSSRRSNSPDEWVTLLGEMISPQVVLASDVLDLDSFSFGAVAFAVVTSPRAEPFVPPKVSWLCDTARRERTGVLNI